MYHCVVYTYQSEACAIIVSPLHSSLRLLKVHPLPLIPLASSPSPSLAFSIITPLPSLHPPRPFPLLPSPSSPVLLGFAAEEPHPAAGGFVRGRDEGGRMRHQEDVVTGGGEEVFL
jgi:hypothetical protein